MSTGSSPLAEVFTSAIDRSDESLLSIEELSVRFGGLAALSNVSLEVSATDLIAVVGPNGAGKSTMLNAVSGLVRSTGSIRLAGRRIDGMRPPDRAQAGIGRSFQDAPLLPRYTVLENVLCGAHTVLGYRLAEQLLRRRKVRRRETEYERRARILLDFVGLSSQANTEAGELSYGAGKRTDLARAMITGPRLLLLDEPSSGLDEHERDVLKDILRALRDEERVAVVYVEHHMDLVRATATDILVLKAGETLMTGAPDQVLDSREFVVTVMGRPAPGPTPRERITQ
jgi:branched-chain amino acid transport system ATP-binding protein